MTLEQETQSIGSDRELVLNTLDEFTAGWENQDAERVLATIARRPDTVIYGTDLSERWIGFEAFVEPVKAQVAAIKNPRYSWGEAEPRIQVSGDAAWASGEISIHMEGQEQTQTVRMRSTFVLIREVGKWRIIQAHFSIGMETPVVAY